jgi:hypothetical protein
MGGLTAAESNTHLPIARRFLSGTVFLLVVRSGDINLHLFWLTLSTARGQSPFHCKTLVYLIAEAGRVAIVRHEQDR